jgi:hypothetical protein
MVAARAAKRAQGNVRNFATGRWLVSSRIVPIKRRWGHAGGRAITTR